MQVFRAACLGVMLGLAISACGSGEEFDCGTGDQKVRCDAGELCVSTSTSAGLSYKCAANPCGDKAVDCSCAASACGGIACGSYKDGVLGCYCPIC
ncbi:MAG: hypothetical protein ACOY0T_02355 [Myxococcota bacterium]